MKYTFELRGQGDDLETCIKVYRVAVAWAAKVGDRFVISLVVGISNSPEDEAHFCSLGQATRPPARELTEAEQLIARVMLEAYQQTLQKLSGSTQRLSPSNVMPEPEIVRVQGTPDEKFVIALTTKAAPLKAGTGELCPVEDLDIFKGERNLYSSRDYGSTQILDLTDEEFESLRQTLAQANLDPTYLVRSLPYVTEL